MIRNPAATLKRTSPGLGYGDYLRFSEFVRERCGLHFSTSRRRDLETGILRAFGESTFTNLDDYYHALLDSRNGSIELDILVNILTIGETHFFRNDSQINALFTDILPGIIKRKRHMKTLRIWSAGCSTGEEPYSIAMLLRELLPDIDDWSITILGTDINTEVIAKAKNAVYSEWAFRETRAKQLRLRYFTKNGNRYALAPKIREMVSFAQLNLVEDTYPAYETNTTFMDLILCRNVTIYFTQAITEKVINRFHDALNEPGWLIIGHSEHSITTYSDFKIHNFPNSIVYQKTDGRERFQEKKDALPLFVFDVEPKVPTFPELKTPPKPKPAPEPSQLELPAEEDPFKKAEMHIEIGQAEKACVLLHDLIDAGNKQADVHVLLGKAYSNLGAWEEAETWCLKAIEIDKLALEAYYILALMLHHQERTEEALTAMKKVVYIDRNYVLGHFNLANIHYSNDQIPAAQKALDNAIRLLDSSDPDALIEDSGGITVGRLHQAIIQQQQQWTMAQG